MIMLQIADTKMSIWNAAPSQRQKNTIEAIGSTCKKTANLETGEVEFRYQNWSVRFKGEAYESSKRFIRSDEQKSGEHRPDRILVKKGIVENSIARNGVMYVWITIFDFEVLQEETE